jgi:hypothetical protein
MADGTEVGTAYITITPSAAGFGSKLQQQITGEAGVAGTKAGQALGTGLTGQASGIAKSVGGIFAAVGAARFLKGAIAEAENAARVGRLTEAVIKSTGGAAGVSAKQVDALAASLSKVAGVDDELIQSGENVLLTFTSIRNQVGAGNDVFNRATATALDMSVALGTDLQGSVIQLGKALNDPVQGMTALSRVGVSFTAQQKEQVKALQESGDLLGAQKVILGEVNREFGGAAAAGATATAKLGVSVGNLKESLGTLLLPAVNAAAGGLSCLIGEVTEAPGPIRAVGGAALLLAGGVTAASFAVGLLAPKIRLARAELEGMGAAGTRASGAIGLLGRAGGILALMEGTIQLASVVTPKVKDMDEQVADLAATVDGKLNKAFHDTAASESFFDFIGATSLLPKKLTTEFDTFTKVLDEGNFALAQRVIASEGDLEVRGRLQTAYDEAIGSTRQFNADQAASAGIIAGVGDAAGVAGDQAGEAAEKWDDLHGTLEDLVASDWSKTLASDFTSALNPLERFDFSGGKDIAGLKDQVNDAKTGLDKANADLAKLEVTGTAGDIARIRGQAGDIDSARAAVDAATAHFNETKAALAEAQKSPLSSIGENLDANLSGLTQWLDDFTKLSDAGFKGGHESLARHLVALGPEAAAAMHEALGLSPQQLDALEGSFDEADAKIGELVSGQFELNAEQAARPGDTLAEILTDRYEQSLVPKLTQATLRALQIATDAIIAGGGSNAVFLAGYFSGDIPGAPSPAPGVPPPAPAPAPALPPPPMVPLAAPIPLPAAPYPTFGSGGVTFGDINVESTADPRLIAAEVGDAVAWRLAPQPTMVG